MMKKIISAGVVALLASSAGQAVVIKPTGATASSEFSSAFGAARTIDGSGLTSPTAINEAHADYAFNNHWTTASGTNPTAQFIDWTFAAPQTIGALYVWNHRSNIIAGNPGYEPTRFDLTIFDAGNNILLSLDNAVLAPDNAFAQRFDFAQLTNVARVRFDVEAVQSSPDFTGLAEVAFDTDSFAAAVPEPASWAMMIGGFGLIGGTLRSRRRNVAFA